jgi:ABC-2 type transport system ATP-binding protein
MLEVRGLTKTYGGILALRNVSFKARPGQVLGYLGPNGSGKSTTINIIVGLLPSTRGAVLWNGVDIHEQLLAYKAIVGYVPEEPRLYGYLTATEYLQLVAGLRQIPRAQADRRISRYLELFGLETDRYAALASFSKGMRQKVLISAALLHDPQLVMLDEPSSGLDTAFTLVMRALVRELAVRGKVIIYTSHVLEEVEKVCSDVIILHEGRIVAHDSVDRVRQMVQAASLEQAFTQLVVRNNVEETGRALADVAAG